MLDKIYTIFWGETDLEILLIKSFFALLIFVGFQVLAKLFIKNTSFLTGKVLKLKSEDLVEAFSASIAKPVKLFLQATGVYLALIYLPFSAQIYTWLYPLLFKGYRMAIIVVISISAQNFLGNITVFSRRFSESKNQTILMFFIRIGKALIIALTAIILLKELDYDINGVVAGLGLGGLTFALAAQDTASNFFSGLVILFDKPFAVGDWIAVGGMEGVVEELNFRSCRIRTFDNALIAVPNSKLSGDSVTNWTKMNLRKTKFTVGLVYNTNKETLQKVCAEIKAQLHSYSEIKQDTILVWFDHFNASSLDIVIQYHSFPISLADHSALREKVHYMVMDVVHANDTDFAFDTKTIIYQKEVQ